MVDFHTHILPGIDDGSSSVEESLAMLRLEAEQGVHHVVATPHFYPHRDDLEDFLNRRAKAAAVLQKAMAGTGGLPELLLGAEVRFFRGISESDALSRLALEGTRCILIEMPPSPWPEEYYRELEGIWRKQGLVPVIAHLDRYISSFRTYGIPGHLAQLPVRVQANAEFFLRKSTARLAMRLLQQDKIHILGSDCHDLTDRPPNLIQATSVIQKRLGEEILERIRMRETDILTFR